MTTYDSTLSLSLRGLLRLLAPRRLSTFTHSTPPSANLTPASAQSAGRAPEPGEADPYEESPDGTARGQNERRPFLAHTGVEQIIGGQWAELFDSHERLSDVWHAALSPDPLLWMLHMSDYRNTAALRHFAIWAAKEVVRFVPGAERPAHMLFKAAKAYTAGISSRVQFDMAYEIYCSQLARATPERDDEEEFRRGISAARSAVHAVMVDDPWGAACDALSTDESTLRFDFSGFLEDEEGSSASVDEKLRLSRAACETASRMFGERAAQALRTIAGDPFLLLDEGKDRRHLELLRQAIRLRPLVS